MTNCQAKKNLPSRAGFKSPFFTYSIRVIKNTDAIELAIMINKPSALSLLIWFIHSKTIPLIV